MALIALRLAIGWHFFQEGSDKIHSGKFSSVGFLSNAKGPLKPSFENMIWDGDGYHRLNKDETLDAWSAYKEDAIAHYGFDDKQIKTADQLNKQYAEQFTWYLGSNAEDIDEYFLGLERRDKYRGLAEEQTPADLSKARAMSEVPSLRGQLTKIEGELKKKRDGWLRAIDTIWSNYERDMNALATDEQRSEGPIKIPRVGRRSLDSVAVDAIIPYFDLTIGILLILGLFTRVASICGALFLASVVLSQWPLAPDAGPSIYQAIEMFALLVLAGTAAGRFAGLDFFVNAALCKCCTKKQES
ncbi:MAG TPA: DoxX family protein [Pirellulaceae bacterium]|nr:DoxX family protein [Pirellulaceae bacterium]